MPLPNHHGLCVSGEKFSMGGRSTASPALITLAIRLLLASQRSFAIICNSIEEAFRASNFRDNSSSAIL